MSGRSVTNYAAGITPAPVGSQAEDKSRWGVLDMEGNVREWTSSKASYYKGSTVQVEPRVKGWIVVRGVSFATDVTKQSQNLPLTFRDWFSPETKHPTIGFRLVRQVP